MAVVTWSPELRVEVKKLKSSQTISTALSAKEQNALDRIFSAKSDEPKEPKMNFWA